MAADERVHATAIALDGKAALIRGPSGAGKSDLALRCITSARSALIPSAAQLICDDQVVLIASRAGIMVYAVDTIVGKLEVRGLGIIEVPAIASAPLTLIVDLVSSRDQVDRLPEAASIEVCGHRIAHLRLHPFENAAELKLLLALMRAPIFTK